MIQQLFNWRTGLAIVAICIVSGTIWYSKYLADKIAQEERVKIDQWAEAEQYLINSPVEADTRLASVIIEGQKNIPVIETNEKDSIIQYVNLDSTQIKNNPQYLSSLLREFKALHDPVKWQSPVDSTQQNFYYYGESKLLNQVRYYPVVQLLIVALFIFITIYAISTRNKSTQNQVWAGMAKETAHQLGTPLSSLQGWVEMLKEMDPQEKIAGEMEKDVNRLKLVSDRFGKIGSTPVLESHNLVPQINSMVEYMKKRAPGKVQFTTDMQGHEYLEAMISPPLFDWVIENLLKNALDAMDGKGSIHIAVQDSTTAITIDVTDTGKGISKNNIAKVFKPGFTTKKRGWGLGLSLSRRIMEQYHKGDLFVKHSEPGKGTTFRVVLKK